MDVLYSAKEPKLPTDNTSYVILLLCGRNCYTTIGMSMKRITNNLSLQKLSSYRGSRVMQISQLTAFTQTGQLYPSCIKLKM
jgi:hypothetical protein